MTSRLFSSRSVCASALIVAAGLAGCSSGGGRVVVDGDDGVVIVDVPGEDDRPQATSTHPGKGRGRANGRYANIPPGHMPPPGKCRVWYPDLPPGQQPPPCDCDSVVVPRGAVLVRG